MNRAEEFTGTTPVPAGRGFSETKLSRWMEQHVTGFAGPLRVEQFKGGQSNPTYWLRTPERDYVLRRKPSGPLLKGAHAVDREAKILQALERVAFPVPHVFAVCTDDDVIGTWFYVMAFIRGRIFWDASFPGVAHAERSEYFDAMNRTLAQLHCVDFATIGLTAYGASGGYIERQIARWSRQYEGDIASAGRDTNMDRLVEWLPAHVPATEEVSIVHGDFRVDNLIFHPTRPQIVAVLDWELSTIGHPLADFTYHLMMYRIGSGVVPGLAGADLRALNIPSESEYITAYCARTGRVAMPNVDYYVAFNMFRLAAIFHGIRGRLSRGTASSARAQDYAQEVAPMARLAWEQVERIDEARTGREQESAAPIGNGNSR